MSAPAYVDSTENRSLELGKQNEQQPVNWKGRNFKQIIPASFANVEISKSQNTAGVVCCCLGIVLIIAGSTMWSVCNDPSSDGCNLAVKISGKTLAGVGCGIICFIACSILGCICCVLGTPK